MNNRQTFEAVFTSAKAYTDETTGKYLQPYRLAWLAWQAATKAALERAEKACEAIETERWALYKGRPPYTGTEQGRADNYVQGESGGACLCAAAIRALKDKP